MTFKKLSVMCFVILPLLAGCGDSGTGVDAGAALQGSFALQTVDGAPLPIAQREIISIDTSGTTTSSCTDYLASMSIDVASPGNVTRSESHDIVCDVGAGVTLVTLESGKAVRTADGWRFDFTGPGVAPSSHYFGRLDGSTLTIERRETDAMTVRQLLIPATVDRSQLVFQRS